MKVTLLECKLFRKMALNGLKVKNNSFKKWTHNVVIRFNKFLHAKRMADYNWVVPMGCSNWKDLGLWVLSQPRQCVPTPQVHLEVFGRYLMACGNRSAYRMDERSMLRCIEYSKQPVTERAKVVFIASTERKIYPCVWTFVRSEFSSSHILLPFSQFNDHLCMLLNFIYLRNLITNTMHQIYSEIHKDYVTQCTVYSLEFGILLSHVLNFLLIFNMSSTWLHMSVLYMRWKF